VDLYVITKLLEPSVDVGLNGFGSFIGSFELYHERAATGDPKESVRVTHAAPPIQLQA